MAKGLASFEMIAEECCACGVIFAVTADYEERRRSDHKWFYCPNGHSQHYSGKTEAERLREKASRLERSRDEALVCCTQFQEEAETQRSRAAGFKGWAVKLKKRATASEPTP